MLTGSLINMDDFLQVIEPPFRFEFDVTHAIINPLLEICGSQTRLDGAGGASEKALAEIIVLCAPGDPRLALGPGHTTDSFGKAITGGVLVLPSGPFLAVDDH
jgi:hypothetical protein